MVALSNIVLASAACILKLEQDKISMTLAQGWHTAFNIKYITFEI